jgi:hypothetical protein
MAHTLELRRKSRVQAISSREVLHSSVRSWTFTRLTVLASGSHIFESKTIVKLSEMRWPVRGRVSKLHACSSFQATGRTMVKLYLNNKGSLALSIVRRFKSVLCHTTSWKVGDVQIELTPSHLNAPSHSLLLHLAPVLPKHR